MTALIVSTIAAIAAAQLGTICSHLADDTRATADIARIEGMFALPDTHPYPDPDPDPDPIVPPWERETATIGERAMCAHFPLSITAEWAVLSSHTLEVEA